MKIIAIILGICFIPTLGNAQIVLYEFCFEQEENCANYLMFPENEPFLTIGTSSNPNNIWQIGIPQKTIFNEALSLPVGLVTDTLNTYSTSDTSSFTIGVNIDEPSNSTWFSHFSLYFEYQVDSDTLNDFGMIEFSPDDGETWIDLVNDPTYTPYIVWEVSYPGAGSISDYPVFTGASNGWISAQLVMTGLGDYLAIPAGNTILWRFTFISDDIESNRDGILIDDISLEIAPTIGVEEISEKRIPVSPNPCTSYLNVDLSESKDIRSFSLQSLEGKEIFTGKISRSQNSIDMSKLNTGVYILKLMNEQGEPASSEKVVKSNF